MFEYKVLFKGFIVVVVVVVVVVVAVHQHLFEFYLKVFFALLSIGVNF